MDTVEEIEAGYKAAMRDIRRQRAEVESRYEKMLHSLNGAELLKVAESCGEEVGEDHCYRCKAWYMWVEIYGDDA